MSRKTNSIKNDLNKILNGDGEKLVENAEELAKLLGNNGVSTSQIRNVFSEVKKMDDKYNEAEYDLQILRSRLAYVAGRHEETEDLQEVLDAAINKINSDKELKRFKDFFEAIVAYHKKYGR